MLEKNPEKRITASKALENDWIKKHVSDSHYRI